MIFNFQKNISENFDIAPNDKILLAVSGGADSVAMLDLFSKAKYSCGIAHCNFRLRGEHSDGDEKFVSELAKKYNFALHKISFDTKSYARKHGISIEMAARDLRYEWFEKIRQDFDYKYIALAHHQNDIIETFFINLVRGTGIRGLSGIKMQNGHLIRPLLFANRQEIISYTTANKLEFREDASNKDTTIIRNKIRHDILPLFTEINPAANKNILKTIQNVYSSQLIVNQKVKEYKELLETTVNNTIVINILELQKLEIDEIVLYELLREYRFNSAQAQDIYKALDGESGKLFFSKTHQLVKDRKALIISRVGEGTFSRLIHENESEVELPNSEILQIKSFPIGDDYKIPTQSSKVALDYDKLTLPLRIRTWQNGDYFYPLGMRQKKKLSDFFTNEKYSITDKQNALLLTTANKIAWILGKRIDNRFKITSSTKRVLELNIAPSSNLS